MADDDQHAFFLPFGPVSSEQVKAWKDEQAREQMSVDSIRHQQQALFEELSQEHLYTLRIILASLVHLPRRETQKYAAYLEGLTAGALKARFDVCPGCGKNHEEEFFKDAGIDPTGKSDSASKVDSITDPLPVKGGEVQSLFDPHAPGQMRDLNVGDLQRMEEYNLDDLRNMDTLALEGFMCKGCGTRYVSIEDRMLRPAGVEGCEGCQNKAKWG